MDGSFAAPHIAHVNRIGTAVPPHDVHRAFIDFAETLLPRQARRLFGRMVERAGIDHRFSYLEPDPAGGDALDTERFYRSGGFPGTGERMRVYERHALGLALAAIGRLAIDPAEITHLIVASCTGFSAPGLDQQIAAALGLPRTLQRTLIGFMGCYAAVPALRAAHHIVRSEPDARVLVLNLELCTLHLQESDDLETVLSFLLFGDAAAACLVTAERVGLALDSFHSHALPGTESLITWRIGDSGFDMQLSGKVPLAIGAALRAERARNAPDALLPDPAAVTHWAVHAGGRTILDAVEQALELPPDALAASRQVLRSIGNVSSATLPFVLARLLDAPLHGPGVALAFGPGLTAESFRFRVL